jgi:hypothetical protein
VVKFAQRLQANPADLIEEAATRQSVARIHELARIFIHATKVRHDGVKTGLGIGLKADENLADGDGVLGNGNGGKGKLRGMSHLDQRCAILIPIECCLGKLSICNVTVKRGQGAMFGT